MEKIYHGGCHCGKIKIRARFDLADGTGKCNCTFCRKSRYWGVTVKPEAFTLVMGENDLNDYQFNTHAIHNLFCKHCGIRVFSRGFIEEIGGHFCAVNIATLEDIDIDELVSAPIYYSDGLHDNWQNPPDEIRHL